MYRWKSLISAVAAAFAAAFAFAAPVFAQEGAWGGDVEDFSAPRPAAELKPEEAGEGDPDFGAALEAASAAEGKSADGKEFAPKNEITVTKMPVKADKPDKKKEKKPKAEGDGEKLGNTMGARLGVGYDIDLGLGFGIGLSDVNKLGVGLNMGWGSFHQYNFATYEGYGFFDWNVNISDDGALRWFFGPGVTFGVYGAESDTKPKITHGKDTVIVNNVKVVTDTLRYERDPNMKYAFSIGLGGRTGLEVDLSFIDPDHALSMLRSSSVSLDVRFVIYLFMGDDQKNYPSVVPTLGIAYSYVFGGGKGKDAKDKEKK